MKFNVFNRTYDDMRDRKAFVENENKWMKA